MKKLLIIGLALSAFNASAGLDNQDKVKYVGDIQYSSFCKAAVNDNVNMLKRSARAQIGEVASTSNKVLRKVVSADGIQCNGESLIQFSKERNASAVLNFLESL
jgi:hypothetical protein